MLFQFILPSPHLRPYVQHFMLYHGRFGAHAPAVVKPLPAIADQGLAFYARGRITVHHREEGVYRRQPAVFVYGQQLARLDLHLDPGETLLVGATFQPTMLRRFLRVEQAAMVGQNFDAEAVLGPGVRQLNERLANARRYDELVPLLEDYLWRHLEARPLGTHPLDAVSRHLVLADGRVPLAAWARATNLSVRQFERTFRQQVGVSPKLFSRIAHFTKAVQLQAARPDLDWLSVALHLGYHDYQHLARDFRAFAGATPAAWLHTNATAPERRLGLV